MSLFSDLYQLIFFPIEVLMQWILEAGYAVTHHYGWSIVFLSMIINCLLLPAYFFAEKQKDAYRETKSQIRKGLKYIKQHFKGQERYFYNRALYKRHQTSPLHALKSTLGLLIQIPFFIAAYHFLAEYYLLRDVSFLGIQDISQPDKLLFGTPLLPFVMTAINLLSALIYTQKEDKKEKYQAWILAGVFFVLLYYSPAALLIYWTVNNLFSLGKNAISHYFNFKYYFIIATWFTNMQSWCSQKIKKQTLLTSCLLLFTYPLVLFYADNILLVHFDGSAIITCLLFGLSLFLLLSILKKIISQSWYYYLVGLSIFVVLLLTHFHPIEQGFRDLFPDISLSNHLLFLMFFILGGSIIFFIRFSFKNKLKILLILNLMGFLYAFQSAHENTKARQAIMASFKEGTLVNFKLNNSLVFLLADAYSGNNALKLAEHFDNSSFYDFLKAQGFQVYPDSLSNYPRTFPTMRALWQMKHHQLQGYNVQTTRFPNQKIFFSGCNPTFLNFEFNQFEMFNNRTRKMQKINCNPNDLSNPSAFESGEPVSDAYFFFKYIRLSIIYHLYSYLLAKFELISVKISPSNEDMLGINKINTIEDSQNYYYYFSNSLKEITLKKKQQFIYLHSKTTVDPKACNKENPEDELTTKGYLRQVKCVNEDIRQTLNYLKPLEDPLIVLMADHGSAWRENYVGENVTNPIVAFNILMAVKWPQPCAQYQNIPYVSPVNLFRYILKCYEQTTDDIQNIPLETNDSYTFSSWGLGIRKDKFPRDKIYKVIENRKVLKSPKLIENTQP